VKYTVNRKIIFDSKKDTDGKRVPGLVRLQQPLEFKFSYEQWFKNGRFLTKELDHQNNTTTTIVLDSETQKSYFPGSGRCIIKKSNNLWLPYGSSYSELLNCFWGGIESHKIIIERDIVCTKSTSTYMEFDVTPSASTKHTLSKFGFLLKCKLDTILVPEEISTYTGQDNKCLCSKLQIKHKKINNLIVPTEGLIQVFSTDKNSFYGECGNITELNVDLDQSSWNVLIEDREFEIKLPKGTQVIDDLHNRIYITSEDKVSDNLDKLAENGRQLINTKPSQNKINYYFPALLTCALFAFLVYLFFKRRRK
jgi:hypothetical protein